MPDIEIYSSDGKLKAKVNVSGSCGSEYSKGKCHGGSFRLRNDCKRNCKLGARGLTLCSLLRRPRSSTKRRRIGLNKFSPYLNYAEGDVLHPSQSLGDEQQLDDGSRKRAQRNKAASYDSERGFDISKQEMGQRRKPLTWITPTVGTDFSFSIIHLLSAVRMAMTTSITEAVEDTDVRPNYRIVSSGENFARNGNGIKEMGPMNYSFFSVEEIVSILQSNPHDPFILEAKEPLQDLVKGVLGIFSSKRAPLKAKGWKPLVIYERNTKTWSWVGPFNSTSFKDESVEEEIQATAWGIPSNMLVKLVDAFANRHRSNQQCLQQIKCLPAPPLMLMAVLDEEKRFKDWNCRVKCRLSAATISPSCDEVRAYFRKEEILRYIFPDRAFSYTAADGVKSTVAPVAPLRCGEKPSSKARDHFMLKPGRPSHITIICLVRDAAARLPGSVGTRIDVCTLVRDSQYMVEDASDAQVNLVVSSALDRLHYERDPCVRFDLERKLWLYLHRDRKEEEFDNQGTSSTKSWKKQLKDHPQEGSKNNLDFHKNIRQMKFSQ